MNIFLFLAVAVFAFALIFLVAGYFSFAHACKRSKRRDRSLKGYVDPKRYKPYDKEVAEAFERYKAIAAESVCTVSRDGLRLSANYIPARSEGNKLVIAFHGYRSCAVADFVCVFEELLERGYSVLAVNQRAHGGSEGDYITFGALEKYDCMSWCEYAVNRFGEQVEIYLYGVSMGGATVLMASGLDLPENVKGIIADCPFTTPWEIIKRRLWLRYKIPVFPMIYFMNYWSRQLAGFDFRADSSAEAVTKTALPILLIHGKEDTYVPISMSEKISEIAGGSCRLLRVDGARHARAYLVDRERYLYEFLKFTE